MNRLAFTSAIALGAAFFAFAGTASADDTTPRDNPTPPVTQPDSQTNSQPDTDTSTTTTPAPNTVIVTPPPATVVQPTVVQPAPVLTADTTTRTEYAGPNTTMIGTGLLILGLSYGTSALVAGTSQHPGDEHLFIPVAGPWIDLANRGDCGAGFARTCDNENTNKALLVTSGIFQGVGVLAVIGGFVMPETRTVRTVTTTAKVQKPTLQIAPMQYGRAGYGLGAVGTF